MENELFRAEGAPLRLNNRLNLLVLVGIIGGIVMIFMQDYGLAYASAQLVFYTEGFLKLIAMALFFIMSIVAYKLKKHLNQVKLEVYEDHIEGVHCGLLKKQSIYLKKEEIANVQYNVNKILSGVNILTDTNREYGFLIDDAENACQVIREMLNNTQSRS
jgi:hypothetical protein